MTSTKTTRSGFARRVRVGMVTSGVALCAISAVSSGHVGAATATAEFDSAGEHSWVVPAGVTQVTVDVNGAHGGDGQAVGGAAVGEGGRATRIQAYLDVTPGDTLYIVVGDTSGNGGGANGGAGGGNGGGASDIRTVGCSSDCLGISTLNSRLIVANGGGGGGAGGDNNAGGDFNTDGANGSGGGNFGVGGANGTGSAGGAAGTQFGSPGAGSLGTGGVGGNTANSGGGGGGGYYGGGGGGGGGFGGGGGGGGAGSAYYAGAGVSGPSIGWENGTTGYVHITYDAPATTTTSATASTTSISTTTSIAPTTTTDAPSTTIAPTSTSAPATTIAPTTTTAPPATNGPSVAYGSNPSQGTSTFVTTPGGTVTVHGEGFGPGTNPAVWLHSDPILLGHATADENGAFVATFTIPASTPVGAHSIVITGTDGDGQSATLTLQLTVNSASLAQTGSPTLPLALVGLSLILGGLVLTRRRPAQA